jgi:hypothetical protein
MRAGNRLQSEAFANLKGRKTAKRIGEIEEGVGGLYGIK